MITLATLPQASEQEVFDQVARHLLKQMKRSENPEGGGTEIDSCRYKYKGLSCAAGCLIGPDEYSPTMEGKNWWGLAHAHKVPLKHSDFIQKLQKIHDMLEPEAWRENLQRLAQKRNLTWKF